MIPAARPVRAAALRPPVADVTQRRILRALNERSRYRYVKPEIAPEGEGWKISSPCCSRRVDPEGGVIDIAWIEPIGQGWRLHARDHAQARWQPVLDARRLQTLLERLRLDPFREFWK
ncbi:MAG: hypothetical protein AB1651_13830 [Pseudomonadota bacterium]